MDYKYLRWQVIDTPGVLDLSLALTLTLSLTLTR